LHRRTTFAPRFFVAHQRPRRLAVGSASVPEACGVSFWPSRCRSVCLQEQRAGTAFLVMLPRRKSNRHRRNGSSLAGQQIICMEADTTSVAQTQHRAAWRGYSITPKVGERSMVARTTIYSRCDPPSRDHKGDFPSRSHGQYPRYAATTLGHRVSPRTSAAKPASFASFLEALPQHSDRVILKSMLEASLADGTRAAYTRSLKLYTAFCRQRGLPDVPASVETIAAFLLYGYQHGLFHGAALRQFSAALRKTHIWRGYAPPQSNPVVADLFAGYQKFTQSRVERLQRVPLLVSDALELAVCTDKSLRSGNILAARDSALILFQFFTFARASTAAQQQLSEVGTTRSVITVRLGHEKNWRAKDRALMLRRT